ncbi:MAG: type IV pilus secretin PilQ [Elusimicrobia bacterium]|nr:type IV pilus secretin PilQ [Elusimicrobiota bacterium]
MKKLITLAVAAIFCAQNVLVAYALEAATVKSVRVSADSVYVATDRPVEYKAFTMDNPPKLVLELLDSRMKTLQEIPVNGGALRRVRTGQFKSSPASVSRVVMELSQKTAYEITRKGNELIVMLGARPAAVKAPMVKDTPAEPAQPAAVPVIAPEPKTPEAPIMMTLEAAPAKAADMTPPVVSKKSSFTASAKNIVDNLPREPITLDYNEADIREVLDMMGAKAGINMIYGEDVAGTLTISLSKVPFDEAFKTILNVKGLAAQQAGDNILRIAAPATFMAEQKKAMLQTRVFFLNYARAVDVKIQVDAVATAESRKANCNADDGNNALIVTDTPIGLDATARLIRSLDRVPKQVLIEAKLVEVSLDNSLDYGISWSAYGEQKGNYFGMGDASNKVTMGGSRPGLQTPNSSASGNNPTTISPPLGAAAGGTGVNLPANVVYGAFRLGKVASSYMFDAVITAAAKKGKAKVLSDPKVATLNNKEANINITTQIPYTTTEVSASNPPVSTTKVTYLTTGIVLKVTPTINSDGRISMKINPSISQPSPTIVPVAGGAPGIDTRSADTSVIVRNGETIVIGGLISDTQSEAIFKVPILGDIPILGYLFKKKSMTRTRMELLIFVTPRILED